MCLFLLRFSLREVLYKKGIHIKEQLSDGSVDNSQGCLYIWFLTTPGGTALL